MTSSELFSSENDLDFGPTLRGLRQGMKVFAQRYTLVRQLGRGGMGVVWLAQDSRLDREVALKFLPESVQGDPVAVDELKRETRRCLELTHPNIVRIFDFEQEEDSAAIAMEYIEGSTLSELRLERPSRVFEADEVLPWLESAVSTLHYAHTEAKLVHRDLKPANFMIDREGHLKLADFGIACRITETFSRVSRGNAAPGAGTLVYMSPQQLMGFPPSVSDDVYSLGATLYELFTSKPPFHSGSIERQIEAVVPPSMAERRNELGLQGGMQIPASWEKAVAACLEKDAAKRPQGVEQVLHLVLGHHTMRENVSSQVVQPPPEQAPKQRATVVPVKAASERGGMPGWLLVTAALVCVGAAWAAYHFGYVVPHEKRIAQEAADRQAALAAEEAANTKRLLQEKEDELKRQRMAEQEARNKQMALQAELDRKQREEAEAQRQKMAAEEQRRMEDAKKPRVLKVPGDYSTIAAAMDAARSIDTVLVARGIYEECITLKSGVELRGEDRDSTIIRNSSKLSNLPLHCSQCESGGVSNLTIEQKIRQSENSRYSAVAIRNSSVTLDNCRVTCLSGHGVSITGSGDSIVANCQITNCGWDGIRVYDNSGQSQIRNNKCTNNTQNGIAFVNARGSIFGNLCIENLWPGIECVNNSVVEVLNNTCSNNKHSGMKFKSGSSGQIKGNNCSDNIYNGIDVQGSSTKAAIVSNRADNNGWFGIIVEAACTPTSFLNNNCSGNSKGDILRTGVIIK